MNTFIPNLVFQSVTRAAANATISPGTMQPWVDEIEAYVQEHGKFQKAQVLYLSFSPPPFFWDYKCKKCRFWVEPDSCTVVEGDISPKAWCALWLPLDGKPAFSWPNELLKGDW